MPSPALDVRTCILLYWRREYAFSCTEGEDNCILRYWRRIYAFSCTGAFSYPEIPLRIIAVCQKNGDNVDLSEMK